MFKKIFFLIVFFSFNFKAISANYDYNKLRFKDYNDLRKVKNAALRTSRKFKFPDQEEQTLRPLKETMKMLFSIPNTNDDQISGLASELESELIILKSYEKVLQDIIDESVNTLNNEKLSSDVRTTAAICIQNLLLEIKPKSLENSDIAKVICRLADKKIDIPKKIQKQTMFKSLHVGASPSKLAQSIMLWYANKKNKKLSKYQRGCPYSKRAI